MSLPVPASDPISELERANDPAAWIVSIVEPATRWLVEAGDAMSVDELRAQARAIEHYATARRLGAEATGAAQVIQRRAEMALGRLLPKETSGPGRGKPSLGEDGFSRDERWRFRLLADESERVEQILRELQPEGKATRAAVLDRLYEDRIRRAERQRVDAEARTIEPAEGDHVSGERWALYPGDMAEVLAAFDAESVDLIVTDPPYPLDALPLWSALAEHASRVLVADGLLVALSGNLFLPDVITRLCEHLSYGWVYCQPLPGSSSRILPRHIGQAWKPWLAFSKQTWPSGRVDWHPDMLDGAPMAKLNYAWEQSVGPAAQLIRFLCPTNGLVLDPFAGTGTYGVAALDMGCRFVGIEADANRFATARRRLTERVSK